MSSGAPATSILAWDAAYCLQLARWQSLRQRWCCKHWFLEKLFDTAVGLGLVQPHPPLTLMHAGLSWRSWSGRRVSGPATGRGQQADLLYARGICLICELQGSLCVIPSLLQLLLDALNLELPFFPHLLSHKMLGRGTSKQLLFGRGVHPQIAKLHELQPSHSSVQHTASNPEILA